MNIKNGLITLFIYIKKWSAALKTGFFDGSCIFSEIQDDASNN